MKNDKSKISCLTNPDITLSAFEKARIIVSLENEKSRVDCLNNHHLALQPSDKAMIISSLEDDDEKLRYMKDSIMNFSEKDKLLIICSLQDEKKFQRFGIIPSDASHKNPLNLPADMTFGVELEAEGEYAKYIEVVKNILDGWEVKGESTLENGVEITSPPLHDKERDINELSTVCMIMNKFGLYSNDDCGRTYTF